MIKQALFISIMTCCCMGALAQAGSLDLTFNSVGYDLNFTNHYSQAFSVLIQPDGKMVAAGNHTDGNFDFAASRYNPDGSPDISFANSGNFLESIGGDDWCYSILLQPDGRLIMTGTSGERIAVVRLLTDGTLDSSFSVNGMLTIKIDNKPSEGRCAALQPDGKILVGGQDDEDEIVVIRIASDGIIDSSFGVNGVAYSGVTGSPSFCNSITIDHDGKIVAAGYATNNMVLIRFNEEGFADNTFDSDGIIILDYDNFIHEALNSVLVQPDDKILVGGSALNDFLLLRFNEDGSADTTFSQDGVKMLDINGGQDFIHGIALQADGKIVATGKSEDNLALMRLEEDGSLDNSFGNGGGVLTSVPNSNATKGNAIALQEDGKIVVAGAVDSGDFKFTVFRYLSDFATGSFFPEEQAINNTNFQLEIVPNPLATSATIRFHLGKNSMVKIELLNVYGAKIKTIIEKDFSEGNHLIEFRKGDLPGGVYFLKLSTQSLFSTGKMIIR